MACLGIDVSENNGSNVNWQAVKDAGMKFAFIRSTYGKTGEDSMFLKNITKAQEQGLWTGAYHYSYALDVENAIREAKHCREFIEQSGVGFNILMFDMEDADGYKANRGFDFSRENITAICKAFIDNVGLTCGIYASEDWLKNYIDWESLGCPVWNAAWLTGDKILAPQLYTDWDEIGGWFWQYTDSLNIDGQIFDGNYCYSDL